MLGGSSQKKCSYSTKVQILFWGFFFYFKRGTRSEFKFKKLQISTPFSEKPTPLLQATPHIPPLGSPLTRRPSTPSLDFSALKSEGWDEGLSRPDT